MWLYSSTWSLAVLGVRYSIAGQGEAIAPFWRQRTVRVLGVFLFCFQSGRADLKNDLAILH